MTTPPLDSTETERERVRLERAERVLVKLRWLGMASWLFILARMKEPPVPLAWPYGVFAASVFYTALTDLLIRRGRFLRTTAAATTLCDSTIVTLICLCTGGIRSPMVPYFYFTVLAGSVRFGVRQTFLVWMLNSFCSTLVFVAAPGPPAALGDLGLEIFYMLFTAVMGSLLSREATEHYRRALKEGDRAGLLLSVNREITSTLDVSELLGRIVREAAHVIPCRGAAILLFDRGRDTVERVLVAGDFAEPEPRAIEASLRRGVLREARERGPLIRNEPRAASAHAEPEFQSENLAVVPIRRRADLGFLVMVDKATAERFTEDDLGLLSAVADQAAVAIENARLVEDVLEARDRGQELLRRLMHAEEQERKRVAGEIHDRMGARFFEFYYTLRRCQDRLQDRDPEAAGVLSRLSAEAEGFSDEIRNLMNELRPTVLDDFGFVEALREYVASLQAQGGLEVTLKIDGSAKSLDAEVSVMLFRVLQEAVLNVRKHASARCLSIELAALDGREVLLAVHDDGVGFDPKSSPRGHYGLLHMKERTEACGGRLAVLSRPHGGTEVRVTVAPGESA
jgi:signal transduction histidine kinase